MRQTNEYYKAKFMERERDSARAFEVSTPTKVPKKHVRVYHTHKSERQKINCQNCYRMNLKP